jgi:hypothetical protein
MNRIELPEEEENKNVENTGGEFDSFLQELLQKKKNRDKAHKNRAEVIELFLKENTWNDMNPWREEINNMYKRIDWSLLYRIDRDSEFLRQGLERTHTGENIGERFALSLEMREKFLEIYKAIQLRELSRNTKESDRQRWFEKFKGLLGVGSIEPFDLEMFFETPEVQKKRNREERRGRGTDFRRRILSELNMVNDIRLNFTWQQVPEEIIANIGGTILSICGLEAENKKRIGSQEK